MDLISNITSNVSQLNNQGQRSSNVAYSNNYNQHEEDLNSVDSDEYDEIEDEDARVGGNEMREQEYFMKRKSRIDDLNLFQYKNIDKFLKRKDEYGLIILRFFILLLAPVQFA